MILQTANGPKEIKVADLDFTNLMCDLEDHDVDVMGLLDDDTRENMKIFKTIRAIIAVLTGKGSHKSRKDTERTFEVRRFHG